MVFNKRFCSEVFLDFLKRLVKQSPRKVFLIFDGHPVHRAIKVKNWIAKDTHNIRLIFLPGYSPELKMGSFSY